MSPFLEHRAGADVANGPTIVEPLHLAVAVGVLLTAVQPCESLLAGPSGTSFRDNVTAAPDWNSRAFLVRYVPRAVGGHVVEVRADGLGAGGRSLAVSSKSGRVRRVLRTGSSWPSPSCRRSRCRRESVRRPHQGKRLPEVGSQIDNC